MARIFQHGFETGTNVFNVAAGNGSYQTSTTRGTWSTYGFTGGTSIGQHNLGANYGEVYIGCGVNYSSFSNTRQIWGLMSPNATQNVCITNDASGHLQARRGTQTGTVLGTSANALTSGAWAFVECHVVISDTVGVFEIKVDGTQWLNLTSQDTRNDAATNGDTISDWLAPSDSTVRIDDLYINDTTTSVNNAYSGDIRISAYIPNAAGDVTGLSRGGTDSGNDYGQIDERPANDATDYVYGTNTTSYDLYNIPNTSGISAVQAVTIWTRAIKNDAGSANIAIGVKYDSDANGTADTESFGSDIALSTTWSYYSRLLNLDPASAAWSAAKIDALQIGVKSR